MGASPVPVLAVIGIYVAIYAFLPGTTAATTYGLDAQPAINPNPSFLDVLTPIFSVIGLIFNALVFNVPDAPIYVRIPVAVIIIGSLAWSIATLIRGN